MRRRSRSVRSAQTLDLYKLEVGRYPSTQEGLQALISAPPGVTNWNGPYWKKTQRAEGSLGQRLPLRRAGAEQRALRDLVVRRRRQGRRRRREQGHHERAVSGGHASRASPRTRREARGVTMLELLVVIAIMGVITAVVIPRFGPGVSTTELKGAARQVASGLRLARSEAMAIARRSDSSRSTSRGAASWSAADKRALRAAEGRRAQALHCAEGPGRRQGRRDPLLSGRRQQRRAAHDLRRRAQVRSRRRLAHRPRRDPRVMMPPRPDFAVVRADRARGFSLIEVLAAFVILALVATALFQSVLGRAARTHLRRKSGAAPCWSPKAGSPTRARRPAGRGDRTRRRRRRPHPLGDARHRVAAARAWILSSRAFPKA